MKIRDMKPGQLCRNDMSAEPYVFLGAVNPHPLFPAAWMIVWWTPGKGYSLDALAPDMELGETFTVLPEQDSQQSRELLKLGILSYQQKGGVIP